MKFGLRYCNIGRYIDPSQAVALVQAGEEAGLESAWTVEHTVVPDGINRRTRIRQTARCRAGQTIFPYPTH